MRLVGPLTSPYVRRTAISLTALHIPFELEELSLFQDWEAFRAINPVVKGPTLVCDSGEVLMDSSLILQYLEATHSSGQNLWPPVAEQLEKHFRLVSLALAACEKAVQMVYELRLRPEPARSQMWLERVQTQAGAALEALEAEVNAFDNSFSQGLTHANITVAVVWEFVQRTLPDLVGNSQSPALAELSAVMEATEVFKQFAPQSNA